MNQHEKLSADIRAGAIAHTIRLGKCPRPGQVMSGKIQLKEIEAEDLAAGRLENAKPQSDLVEIEFVVERADIDRAIALINSQRAKYREPKTTEVKL